MLAARRSAASPRCWAVVGSAKARVNQSRTSGWKGARAGAGAVVLTREWYPGGRSAPPGPAYLSSITQMPKTIATAQRPKQANDSARRPRPGSAPPSVVAIARMPSA